MILTLIYRNIFISYLLFAQWGEGLGVWCGECCTLEILSTLCSFRKCKICWRHHFHQKLRHIIHSDPGAIYILKTTLYIHIYKTHILLW